MTPLISQKCKHLGLSVDQEIEYRKLDPIYTEMRNRQLKVVQASKQMRSDNFFSTSDGGVDGNKHDDRRCLAISSVIDKSCKCDWTGAYQDLMEKLRTEFGGIGLHYYQDSDEYSNELATGQLHWTLMQVVGFADFDAEVGDKTTESTFLNEAYQDCIQDTLTVGGLHQEIQITFIGVILVSTGLLMVGVPSTNVNEARDLLREKLKERDLPLKEPFLNDIIHSTLFRVISHQDDPDLYIKMIALAKQFEDVNLGTVTLNTFQIGPASWRMLSDEVNATPPTRQWNLAEKTPWEAYEQGLSSGMKNNHTVSGITGFSLAKEIRGTLEGDSSDDPIEDNGFEKSTSSQSTLTYVNCLHGIFQRPGLSMEQCSATGEGSNIEHKSDSDRKIPETNSVANRFMDLSNNHASTVSGVVGQELVVELKKKLNHDERMIWSLYNTDFY